MSIDLEQITKSYAGQAVVHDVSLGIPAGEFFVLLGPSGSGKSTLLRAIAGLVSIDRGRIALHGRDLTDVPTRRRGVGYVFQNYALFRHLTVAENIEFALRVQGMRPADRRQRCTELLRLVALEGMDRRMPYELSGGQQQRVAVARALAHRPGVLLLDEPFGALDARIRDELRRTIRAVQRELGITTVLVTHDQEEAFALADRIGVMHQGRLLECAPPARLYESPGTRFVATFLGAANLLLATDRDPRFGLREGIGEAVVVVRPEDIELARSTEQLGTPLLATGTVTEVSFNGAFERVGIRPDPGMLRSASEAESARVLQVSRPLQERRAMPLAQGDRIAAGFWRSHPLPTPISSVTIRGRDATACDRLLSTPLLAALVQRMALPVERVPLATPGVAAHGAALVPRGILVLDRSEPDPLATLAGEWADMAGALLMPPDAPVPRRVVVQWIERSSRERVLATAASLLRHLPADAVAITLLPPDADEASRIAATRHLLDGRAQAQAGHGLELRTELVIDDDAAGRGDGGPLGPATLLVLGCGRDTGPDARVRALLGRDARQPVLIVPG
jgi:sulfate transport system ATP-binding protein